MGKCLQACIFWHFCFCTCTKPQKWKVIAFFLFSKTLFLCYISLQIPRWSLGGNKEIQKTLSLTILFWRDAPWMELLMRPVNVMAEHCRIFLKKWKFTAETTGTGDRYVLKADCELIDFSVGWAKYCFPLFPCGDLTLFFFKKKCF